MCRSCLFAGMVVSLFAAASPAEDEHGSEPSAWKYTASEAGDDFEHPPLQPLRLAEEMPDEVRETAGYRGTKRLYALIRYGSPDSKRVVVVVDELGDREFDLYVDANRNWVIEDRDRIEGKGAYRRSALKAEITREDHVVEYAPRSVILRRGLTGSSLGFATRGYVEGTVQLGDRILKARRLDGDGNGFFADGRDRIWIDLSEDGRWDAFSEQFPFMPILPLEGKRYAPQSDAIGNRLALREIVGTGTVRLKLDTIQSGARILDLDAMLVGADGSAFALRGGDGAVSVPVGRYALGTVTLRVEDPKTKLPWSFLFSRIGAPPQESKWYEVAKGGEVAVDPIGTPRFELEIPNRESGFAAGDSLTVQPRLYTADGLLINSCAIGKEKFSSYEESSTATVRLVGSRGEAHDTQSSGFA